MAPAMNAPPAPLFRFAGPPEDAAAAAPPAARPAAWRTPVAACGAALAGTAALIVCVLPSDAPAPRPAAAGVRTAAADGRDAEPVVPALHVSDGRPVRATPQDTLPEDAAPAAVVRADAVFAGVLPPAPVPAARPVRTAAAVGVPGGARVAPAVWLTGEIRP